MPSLRSKDKNKLDALDNRDLTASVLVAVGALNWGLVGLFDVDLVAGLFGHRSKLSRLVYTGVGASAVYLIAQALEE
ncbi:MAG TPA: DUF378 domain-containing protein [Actinomycetota bacterium]|nr:DUF378 domain-containing protein [Actinomycetota bacterium]